MHINCKFTLQLVRGIEQDNNVKRKSICAKVMQAYLESQVLLRLIGLEDTTRGQKFITNCNANYVTDLVLSNLPEAAKMMRATNHISDPGPGLMVLRGTVLGTAFISSCHRQAHR